MIKKLFAGFIFLFILFLSFPVSVFAISDPISVPNNKFGIHITGENDLDSAYKLVNSNGGDWGYVTFVITEGERDHDRWQKTFDAMRRFHIIPIVRLATKAKGPVWEKPQEAEINNWIAFLNSLNWVIQNRYVIIGNEPNLDGEWGGKANAAEYAAYLETFSQKLKSTSSDFFVLPAGLAPEPTEFKYLRQMIKARPQVFDNIDGWTSHPYPTASIDLYKEELRIINKDLPVFITETGWSNKNLSENEIGKKLTYAFQNVWNDKRVVAVTPFILNYPQEPFGIFSWTKSDGNVYSFYETVKNLPKVKGEPIQIIKGDILGALAQPIIPIGSDYIGVILARNTGQSIWNSNEISIRSDFVDLPIKTISFQDIEPTRLGLVVFKAAAPENTGIYTRSLFLRDKKNLRVTNSFPIEAYLVKIDQEKIKEFFGGLLQHINLGSLVK